MVYDARKQSMAKRITQSIRTSSMEDKMAVRAFGGCTENEDPENEDRRPRKQRPRKRRPRKQRPRKRIKAKRHPLTCTANFIRQFCRVSLELICLQYTRKRSASATSLRHVVFIFKFHIWFGFGVFVFGVFVFGVFVFGTTGIWAR